jgi:hypothetical protein
MLLESSPLLSLTRWFTYLPQPHTGRDSMDMPWMHDQREIERENQKIVSQALHTHALALITSASHICISV